MLNSSATNETNGLENATSRGEGSHSSMTQASLPSEDTELLDNKRNNPKAVTITQLYHDNIGLLLVAVSQAFFSVQFLLVKVLKNYDPSISALQFVWVRMMITYFCCFIFMTWKGIPDRFAGPKGVRLLLVFRGASGFIGLSAVYYSLQYLSLSDATVLTFLSPLGCSMAGVVFLKETFSYRQLLAGLFSLLGVVLIAQPEALFGAETHLMDVGAKPTPAERMRAVGISMIGVLGTTGAYTSIAAIGKRAHSLHSLNAFSALSVLASGFGLLVTKTPIVVPSQAKELSQFLLIGIIGFVAQVFLTSGLQRETAGRGSMALYTQILYATFFEYICFGTTPTALSALGSVIIIFSAIYVVLSKRYTKKPDSNPGDAEIGDSETGPEGVHVLEGDLVDTSIPTDSRLVDGIE